MTRLVRIRGVEIGAGRPIAIQSMTKTDTRDVRSTVSQILELRDAGCDVVRLAVVDMEAAEAIKKIRGAVGDTPLVADIHFDYRLALESVRNGVDKLRINPGNIGDRYRVKQVADAAKERGVPIRIGVNGGSLEKGLLEKYGGATAAALAESALNQAEELSLCGFDDTVVSMKSSDVFVTIEACRLFDQKNTGIPQHIGVTEAGMPTASVVKSAICMYELLRAGIGDTLRVSITGDPVEEVVAAKALLQTIADLNPRAAARGAGVELIACPSCGRCRVDLVSLAKKIERRTAGLKTEKHIKVAVMGCAVNGPGEARAADVGIAAGDGKALLFKHGSPQYQVPEAELADVLLREIASLL